MSSNSTCDIAIIGMSGIFPGAKNYLEFWQLLNQGKSLIREIPSDRWDHEIFYNPQVTTANTTVTKWAGVLDDIRGFDHTFFNISADEAKAIDPQTRLFLQEAWHCFEDAAIALKSLEQARVSVYFGVSAIDYFHHMSKATCVEPYAVTGAYPCMGAHRVSHFFNFQGASFSVDAACAASFVALHEAKLSLLHGTCDYALVGAANLINHPWHLISLSKCRVLSPDGQCKTFDKSANGYVRGEGVGVFLLSRKEHALMKKHRIHAMIKGVSLNHSGKTKSISTPNANAQIHAIRSSLNEAQLEPRDIDYIETHGTGTILGDAIEFNALNAVFQEKIPIGSVKANIGHLEAASGFASLFKVILMMKQEKIPQQINVAEFNPMLELETSQMYVPLKEEPWLRKGSTYRAGITALGFGGLNAHVIVEEHAIPHSPDCFDSQVYPVLLSARSDESLKRLVENWKSFIQSKEFENAKLQDIVFTLLKGREHFEKRLGFICHSKKTISLDLIDPKPSEITDSEYVLIIKEFDHLQLMDSLSDQEKSQVNTLSVNQKKKKDVQSFLQSYSMGKLILKCAPFPRFISGEGMGYLAALVLSQAIDFPKALECILKKNRIIQGESPKIPLFDPIYKEMIPSFGIDELFCCELMEGIKRVNHLEQAIFNKVKNLYSSQLTLKKYLNGIDLYLHSFGISVIAILQGKEAPKEAKQLAMINLALFAGLDHLYQKYHIKLQHRSAFAAITILRQLLMEQKLNFQQAVEILTAPLDRKAILSEAVNRPIKQIYEISKTLCPLPESALKDFRMVIGDSSRKGDYVVANQEDLFNALLRLWMRGKNIDWGLVTDLFFQDGQPVSLPGYSF